MATGIRIEPDAAEMQKLAYFTVFFRKYSIFKRSVSPTAHAEYFTSARLCQRIVCCRLPKFPASRRYVQRVSCPLVAVSDILVQ